MVPGSNPVWLMDSPLRSVEKQEYLCVLKMIIYLVMMMLVLQLVYCVGQLCVIVVPRE